MTEYIGVKSLDAEITLDFINHNVVMDYSLNKFGRHSNSNTSTIFNDVFKELSYEKRLYETLIYLIKGIFLLLTTFVTVTISDLIYYQIATSSKIHSIYQKFMVYKYVNLYGIFEQSKFGKLNEPGLIFHIPSNLWFEYNLDGDYKNKIKSISLKRCFCIHYKFGKYKRQKQDGWNVIFEFTDIPQDGSCILRYI